ncbi:Methylthioribose-1-phosphate isomerase [Clarias magur]|uniref:Methylthioribose-1-phosphate isomerase n=1 Tax=Clarias magur TaxID=1594786 RepID=A0A8J4U924_CLAMG|nr:Methylthioribose-1-phosphate isomerase [Clarias magur]
MLDLHYDTLLSDGISGWAVAQGERGKRLCSPCPFVPQRVRESGLLQGLHDGSSVTVISIKAQFSDG